MDTTTITFGDFSYIIKDDTVIIEKYKGTAEKITIPSVIESKQVTSIGARAFYDCLGLLEIIIPSSVKSIGEQAFSKCKNLTEIKVSPENQNFTDIDGVLFNKDKTKMCVSHNGIQKQFDK